MRTLFKRFLIGLAFANLFVACNDHSVDGSSSAGLSIDASLSALTISSGTLTPVFASDTTDFTASVANTTTSLFVTPTSSDINATIEVNIDDGNYSAVTSGTASDLLSLNVGADVIGIKVTAEDGITIKNYTVTVTRADSTDASLSALTLSSGTLAPVFHTATTEYTAAVANTITSLSVTPTSTNSSATIEVNINDGIYSAVTSGTASELLSLDVGANVIGIKITAEDGVTIENYTVTVTRAASADATLSNIGFDPAGSGLSPVFSSGQLTYTIQLDLASPDPNVTVTTTNTNATMQAKIANGSYATITSGVPFTVTTPIGVTILLIKVRAADGITTQTYQISITKLGTR